MKETIDSTKYLTFGIQGGKGSFNEQALAEYTNKKRIKKFKTKYLFTTEKVLIELNKGSIDYGQFAIYNSAGGIVDESIEAMSKHKFRHVESFRIPIQHFLMKRPEIPVRQIDTIMAHDQVFKQCKNNLREKHPDLKQITGTGNLIDTAKAAESLAAGNLPKNIAILGPRVLSDLYNLEIIDSNLQDMTNNLTTFRIVKL